MASAGMASTGGQGMACAVAQGCKCDAGMLPSQPSCPHPTARQERREMGRYAALVRAAHALALGVIHLQVPLSRAGLS